MNDMEVGKQVQQMVQFIRQEAEEKANEISVSAEEEFNIEKLQIVEAEKKKIRQEFERKEKQVEVRRKIEYSTQLNASRLKLLQAQDDLVRKMKDAAEKQLRKVGSSEDEEYPKLVEALVIQGLLRLKEPSTQLRCREQDLETVQSVIESAKQAYAEKEEVEVPEVFVDDKHFLPGPPGSTNHGSSCTGGVVLATKDGRIVLENTLDARLEVVFKQQLPEKKSRVPQHNNIEAILKVSGQMTAVTCKCGAKIICPLVKQHIKYIYAEEEHSSVKEKTITINSKSQALVTNGMCVVCMTTPPEGVYVPCGHLVTCMDFISKMNRWICTICRASVEQVVKVYTV